MKKSMLLLVAVAFAALSFGQQPKSTTSDKSKPATAQSAAAPAKTSDKKDAKKADKPASDKSETTKKSK